MIEILKKAKGFTRNEWIVMIAVFGILAAVLIPSLSSMVAKGNKATEYANAKAAYLAARIQAEIMISNGTPYIATKYTFSGEEDAAGYRQDAAPSGTHAPDNMIQDMTHSTYADDSGSLTGTGNLMRNFPIGDYISEIVVRQDGTVDYIVYTTKIGSHIKYDGETYTQT